MRRLLVSVFFAMIPTLAYSATYYVAKTGDDRNSCTQAQSESTPKLTINAGLSCLSGGDTLIIGDGTYVEAIGTSAIPSGLSDTQRTIIKARNTLQVILKPTTGNNINGVVGIYERNYITLDGLVLDRAGLTGTGHPIRIGGNGPNYSHYITVQNGIVRNNLTSTAENQSCVTTAGPSGSSSNLRFINLEVYNCGPDTGHGIYIRSKDSLIERCRVHDAASHGIHLYNSSMGIDNNIIRYNEVYGNGSWGILLGAGNNNVAHNNIVRNNGKGGVRTGFSSPQNSQFYFNTIYSNGGRCIHVRSDSKGVVLKNNICWKNASDSILNEGTNTAMEANLFDDPSFVDPSVAKFTLRATSAAIKMGVQVSGITFDLAGTPIPSTTPDVGAYQYTGGTSLAAPSNLRTSGN